MCDNLGIPDKIEKKKVYLYSDNCECSDIVFFELQSILEIISAEEHNQEDEYEYTIKIAWMTETEIENLPEAEF